MVDATTAPDKMAKKSSKKQDGTSAKITDARFANIQTDPRFKLPSKTAGRTKIDSRFSRMLKDDEVIASAKVDKYGRRLKSDNKKKALQYLYTEEDEEDNEEEDDEPDDDELVKRELQKADAKYDPARGGGFSSSDSESDEEEDEDEAEAEAGKPEGSMQKLRDEQADVEVGEVTKRIAIVNLDWDHIKSIDLMSLFSSFVPKGGEIKRVSIFPSDFGKERMQNEELEGPPRDIFKKKTEDEEEEEEEDDSEDDSEDDGDEDDEDIKKEDIIEEGEAKDFDSDALRAYQLDRLRYYYAVMECSDETTAEAIYKATDGTEYQSSSNFLDLRFVPDDVTFDDEPRDSCNALPSGYRPAEFVTDALQHSRVKLTWDLHPDEAQRREKIQRAFAASKSELEEEDLHAYLASDSDEDDEQQEQQEQQDVADGEPKLSKKELARQKMRAALGLGPEPGKASQSGGSGEMEMTFVPGESDVEEKRPKPAEEEETTIEKYMRKEREKKAKRKEKAVAKREAANAAETNEDAVIEQNVDLGFDDPFFTTEKPTKPSKHSQRKEERLKKRQQREAEAAESAKQKAQLEKIMAEGSGEVAEHLDHFDMTEIAKAEKLKNFKKGKKGKQKELAKLDGLQDNFKMDVGDERFKAVFESHEFAIDPSDPKFKATPGMKMLLEEGRKKRGKDAEEGGRSSKKARRH